MHEEPLIKWVFWTLKFDFFVDPEMCMFVLSGTLICYPEGSAHVEIDWEQVVI